MTGPAWQEVNLGEDVGPHRARLATQEDDYFLHGYLKFGRPHEKPVMLTVSIDLRPIEAEVQAELEQRTPPGAVSGGRFFRRLKRKIKHAVKKIAHSKLVKGITKIARKVIDNPLVKGVLAATPYGAAFLAVRAAARVAAKAIRGGHKAKAFIAETLHRVKHGDPQALKVARLLKQGIKYAGIAPKLQMSAAAGAAGERDYLAHMLSAALQNHPPALEAGGRFVAASGEDYGAGDDHELEAVDMVATSGAFEGVRWLASRLSLHSMVANPDEFTARNALMLGHSVLAAPRG